MEFDEVLIYIVKCTREQSILLKVTLDYFEVHFEFLC